MKILWLTTISILFLAIPSQAQHVLHKHEIVSLDGKPILTYTLTKIAGNHIYSYTAPGETDILFQVHYCRNWSYPESDDYRHYYFPESGREMILPRRRKNRFRYILPLLVEEGVLDREGQLDNAALATFIERHHVPLPRSFGNKEHRLPILGPELEIEHHWQYVPEYDPETRKWRD